MQLNIGLGFGSRLAARINEPLVTATGSPPPHSPGHEAMRSHVQRLQLRVRTWMTQLFSRVNAEKTEPRVLLFLQNNSSGCILCSKAICWQRMLTVPSLLNNISHTPSTLGSPRGDTKLINRKHCLPRQPLLEPFLANIQAKLCRSYSYRNILRTVNKKVWLSAAGRGSQQHHLSPGMENSITRPRNLRRVPSKGHSFWNFI